MARSTSIEQRFATFFRTNLWLLGLLLLATALPALSMLQIEAAQQRRYHSYLLADELRQSSDDLTRLARTYVLTGDDQYERQYWDVLAIRNGEKPRPVDYWRIYWDFVAAGDAKPRPDSGQRAALTDLMKEAGFTAEEFQKLELAKKNSDGLVKTETIAMNAVKGLFDDGAGRFTVKKAPDRELAARLMHDPAYHAEKAKIMRPIDEFFQLLDARTEAEVTSAIRLGWLAPLAAVALALALLLRTRSSARAIKAEVVEPLQELSVAFQRLAETV